MLKSIDKAEVLRYLGYKGNKPDEQTDRLVDLCIEEILKTAKPAVIYAYFNIDDDMILENTVLSLEGSDIKKHLRGCKKCVLMAATLGIEVERKIMQHQVGNMAKALILDACATAAIEHVCDNLCRDIEKQLGSLKLTSRFSPGYGDFPIELQKDFISVLDAGRKIGLTITNENIMIPRKSVTAVMGISSKNEKAVRGCDNCRLKGSCNYRKEGKYCE